MRNGAISGQARLFAAVSDLDASPAPATEVAADRLVGVMEALVPGDLSLVCLGEGGAFASSRAEGRLLADLPVWAPSGRGREHPVVAFHDSTGLLVICQRADVGSLRSLRPTIDYGHFWRPFGVESMVGAPVGFPTRTPT
jgi:hypothetical protein